MLHFPRWKIMAIIATCLAGLLFSFPNFFAKEQVARWPRWVPHLQMPFGLDLQGGAHLLLEADSGQLKADWLKKLRGEVRKVVVTDAKLPASVTIVGSTVQVRMTNPDQADAAMKELRSRVVQPIGNAILGSTGNNIDVTKGEGGLIVVQPTEQGLIQRETDAISAAIDAVNRRINNMGTAESTVIRQGRNRILVQFPGVQDTAPLKAILLGTAKLTFHEVHPTSTPEDANQGRAPLGYTVYPSEDGYAESYLLRTDAIVEGEDLTDAQPGQDQRTGEWIISFRFNLAGARAFSEFTRNNVGRPFAIVIDKKVLSAPVIREPITGGSGQISGRFTAESATTLALQLRSGALPVDLTIVEERTVGPSLGADSIGAGKLAGIIGGLATLALTVFAYGTFGIFACVGLLVHLVLTVALMTVFGSTLTLPGIAGLVLGVAMAVDANVLIYERIREEVRSGKTPIAAIDAGFTRAFVTIADSQLTTLACAAVMFWLGSGPIRGFAITLTFGILTSIFASVTVVRLLVWVWLKSQAGGGQRKTLEVPV